MLRLAVNGYGRIGRCVLRALHESPLKQQLQVVAINELADARTVLHLSKYDSTHGRFPGKIAGGEDHLLIDDHSIRLLRTPEIGDLPWADLGVDMTPRLKLLKAEEPPVRQGGVKVADVEELVSKLRNEAKVI